MKPNLDTRRAFSLLALLTFGLLAARLTVSDHAPDRADAWFTLGFAAVVAIALRLDRPLVLPAPFGAVSVLLVALLMSVATSWHPLVSLLSVPAALCALAAFLAVCALGQHARAPALLALLTGGALSSTAALVQRFITWPDALRRKDELGLSAGEVARLAAGRPLGLTISPDLMSALALAGAVAGMATLSSKNPLVRSGAGLLTLVCVVGLVLSRSAGGALAAGVLFATWAFIVVVRGLRGPAALLTVGGALLLPVALVLVLGRGIGQLARSAGERLENWEAGLAALASEPFTGVGFARFSTAYLAERAPEANVTRYAHSFFVQALSEGGVLFGGLLLVVVVGGIAALLHARIRGRPDRSRDVVLAGVVALLARASYDYDLQVAATATSFAALLAVAWLDAQKDGPVLTEGVLPATARRRTALASFALAALVVVGTGAAALGTWRDAALVPFTAGAPTAEDLARVQAWAERVPSDPHAALIVARLYTSALSRCQPACAEVEARARAFADVERPHPPADVHFLRAVLAERRDDDDAVTAALERALAADPRFAPAHHMRIRRARAEGDARLPAYEAAAARWRVKLDDDAR